MDKLTNIIFEMRKITGEVANYECEKIIGTFRKYKIVKGFPEDIGKEFYIKVSQMGNIEHIKF